MCYFNVKALPLPLPELAPMECAVAGGGTLPRLLAVFAASAPTQTPNVRLPGIAHASPSAILAQGRPNTRTLWVPKPGYRALTPRGPCLESKERLQGQPPSSRTGLQLSSAGSIDLLLVGIARMFPRHSCLLRPRAATHDTGVISQSDKYQNPIRTKFGSSLVLIRRTTLSF